MTSLQGKQIGTPRSTAPCKSCHAPIMWVKGRTGKNIPLDPEPVPNGNLILIDGVAYVTNTPTKLDCYVSHFATCPQAAEHRKKR